MNLDSPLPWEKYFVDTAAETEGHEPDSIIVTNKSVSADNPTTLISPNSKPSEATLAKLFEPINTDERSLQANNTLIAKLKEQCTQKAISGEALDLSGLDFSKLADELGANSPNAVLKFLQEQFPGKTLSEILEDADLSGSDLTGMDFSEFPDLVLDGLKLIDTNLAEANLEGVVLRNICEAYGLNLTKAQFTNCSFKEASFQESEQGEVSYRATQGQNCNMTDTYWNGAKLYNVFFVAAEGSELNLNYAMFNNAKIRTGDFQTSDSRLAPIESVGRVNMRESFRNVDLSQVNFAGSQLLNILIQDSKLVAANLFQSSIDGLAIMNCSAAGLTLSNSAKAQDLHIQGSDLTGAKLDDIQLNYSPITISSSTLNGAEFRKISSRGHGGYLIFNNIESMPGTTFEQVTFPESFGSLEANNTCFNGSEWNLCHIPDNSFREQDIKVHPGQIKVTSSTMPRSLLKSAKLIGPASWPRRLKEGLFSR